MGDAIVLSVDLNDSRFQEAMRAAPRRTVLLVRRGLQRYGTQVVTESKKILTSIKNKGRRGGRVKKSFVGPLRPGQHRGTTAQSIHRTRVKKGEGGLFTQVRWRSFVGPLLEWGPQKKAWDIKAKYAGALRFQWPNAPMGGFTATISKRGKVGRLRPNVFYYKKVRHRFHKSHLRVHVQPAADKVNPAFVQFMAKIPHAVMS